MLLRCRVIADEACWRGGTGVLFAMTPVFVEELQNQLGGLKPLAQSTTFADNRFVFSGHGPSDHWALRTALSFRGT